MQQQCVTSPAIATRVIVFGEQTVNEDSICTQDYKQMWTEMKCPLRYSQIKFIGMH